jgi:putative hydrolase of the HAD superfamily
VIKAIIFDCFGVIVGKGFEHTYYLAGGDPKADKEFIDYTLARANLGYIDDDKFSESMANKIGISLEDWRESEIKAELPDEQLLSFIKDLRKTYKTAILSNANGGILERKIGKEELRECFDEVIVSAEVGLVKPNPEIYKYAADKLDVELNECLFIDDKKSFTEVANSLGMSSIVYKDFIGFKKEIDELL